MEQQNKYYTPSIEDICVGYEGEINWDSSYNNIWTPFKIKVQDGNDAYTSELSEIVNAVHDGMSEVRTPYLTKEQIEAEGWEFSPNYEGIPYDPDELGFLKEMEDNLTQYLLYYNPSTHHMRIEKIYDCGGEGWIFRGMCPSINEFRKLCKLLSI